MKAIPFSTTPALAEYSRSRREAGAPEEALLRSSETMSVHGRRVGLRFRPVEGTLWITQEGDHADYLVRPGETFVSTRPGRIVAQPLGTNSRFVFTSVE